jgi:hypothetical protein
LRADADKLPILTEDFGNACERGYWVSRWAAHRSLEGGCLQPRVAPVARFCVPRRVVASNHPTHRRTLCAGHAASAIGSAAGGCFRRPRAWASRDSPTRCSSRCPGWAATQRSGSRASPLPRTENRLAIWRPC